MSQHTISPDGKWLWNGSEWIPAPPKTEPQAVSEAAPIIEAVSQEYSVPKQELQQTSAHFDLNQDGQLSYEEVQQAAQSISNPAPQFTTLSNSKSSNKNIMTSSVGDTSKKIIISSIAVVILLILGSTGFLFLSPVYSPLDSIRDTDLDGWADADDAFPEDSTQTLDADGDGYGDNLYGASPDAFTNDSTQWKDSDGDGYGDNPNGSNPDAFPLDQTQWLDSDGDGYGDNSDGNSSDDFILDSTQWRDFDGDGYGDNPLGNNSDAFPTEKTQWLDTDGDGHGDNPNGNSPDSFITDSTQWQDTDGDGYGDNPLGNNPDAFPSNSSEWNDIDSDGIGDNSDDCSTEYGLSNFGMVGCPDSDFDGWADALDTFPADSSEWLDDDDDGIGNNADLLDDGDAFIKFDVISLQADTSQDYDIFGNAPDMYFSIWYDADCDDEIDSEELVYSSSYTLDSYYVSSSDGQYVYFNIPDDASQFCFGILVYDSDDSDDDLLDYVTGQGSWATFTRTLSDGYSSTIECSNNESGEYKSVNMIIYVYVW